MFQLLNISWQNIHVVTGQRLILCDMSYCITVLLYILKSFHFSENLVLFQMCIICVLTIKTG